MPDDSESLQRLNELQEMKVLISQLSKEKKVVKQYSDAVQEQDQLLNELSSHLMLLEQEKNILLYKLNEVQQELSSIHECKESAKSTRSQLASTLYEAQSKKLEPLQEKIDQIREKHRLPKLPSFQEEREIELAKLLEKRKQNTVIDIMTVNAGTSKKRKKQKK
jgi:hypothetical protein